METTFLKAKGFFQTLRGEDRVNTQSPLLYKKVDFFGSPYF